MAGIIYGYGKTASPGPSDRILLWLEGTLTPGYLGSLVIPACQSRALRIGFSTGDADLKIFIIVKVNPDIWMLKKIGVNRQGGVFTLNYFKILVDFFLVLLPTS